VSSCYYDYGLSTSDYDAILTNYDKATDFGTYKTFFLPDTVLHLIGEDDKDEISRGYDKQILSAIRGNMTARGYVEVDLDTANLPDVVMTVSIATSTWVGGGYYYPYYPGWGWGYYPGWGYGTYYYTYETGTVIVDLIDKNDLDPGNPDAYALPKWNGTMQGIVSDVYSNSTRVINGINQMFYQSPYLVAGNN